MGMGGIQRTFYIPRYLSDLDWKVRVYTPNPPRLYPKDMTVNENDDIEVIRSLCPDPMHFLGRVFKTPGMGRVDYFSFPDNKIPWLPFLYNSLKGMDLVVTSVPPFSLLLSGFFYIDTPWVIDFRDPWVGSFLSRYKFKYEEIFAKKLERYGVEKAALCITVTQNHLEYLKSNYPEHSHKFHLIRNGYNEEDFPSKYKRESKGKIIITYMGTLNMLRPIEYVFEGLQKLFEKRPEMKDRFIFKHIGYSIGVNVEKLAKEAGIRNFLSTGYLPHNEALRELLDSDILLLLGVKGEQDKDIIPGKLYEYIRSSLPIIAVTTNEEIEELINLQGVRCGYDASDISKCILRIIDNPRSFGEVENLKDFSWKYLTKKYSTLLSSVL
jgi:glycosyltransferase involved in cell wall biosynthesis